ncbi:Uncharacterised protein [Amycolatopsis camponoti]|uniref:Uncharacterized protein n=1 Tax=Amycolatopsis camponoti TaxID=2606593 RepID=A0A6I8LKM8_9PSEU|nr:Uncharacterised protein [Amycolatopsis camponoti]
MPECGVVLVAQGIVELLVYVGSLDACTGWYCFFGSVERVLRG